MGRMRRFRFGFYVCGRLSVNCAATLPFSATPCSTARFGRVSSGRLLLVVVVCNRSCSLNSLLTFLYANPSFEYFTSGSNVTLVQT